MTTTAIRSVREITTGELAVGDTVDMRGIRRTVRSLVDTGRPAVFGTGTEWAVDLEDEQGRRTQIAAATSQRWARV